MTPTARALKDLKEMGYLAAVVERWNQYARIRQDLFGCIDLIALREGVGVLFVQACAGASHAARVAKVRAEPRLPAILASGARVEVWSYAKQGAHGKRKTWTLRREEVFSQQ
jgi:hypothetical protein